LITKFNNYGNIEINILDNIIYEDIYNYIINHNSVIFEGNNKIKRNSEFKVYKRYSNTQYEERLPINSEYRTQFIKLENKLREMINGIGEFDGYYRVRNRKIRYTMESTEHWINKYHRKEFDDPFNETMMVNPRIDEGINLIYSNRDMITKYMDNNKFKYNSMTDNNGKVISQLFPNNIMVKIKDKINGYSMIFAIKYIKKNKYKILLISQIKGVSYNHIKRNTIPIWLYNDGRLFGDDNIIKTKKQVRYDKKIRKQNNDHIKKQKPPII